MPENQDTLKPDTILHDKYYITKKLGRGSFGITYKAHEAKNFMGKVINLDVAIKEYMPTEYCIRDKNGLTILPKNGKSEEFNGCLERFVKEAITLTNHERNPARPRA